MKPWIFLVIAVIVILFILLGTTITQKTQPVFEDRRQVVRTIATEDSSYAQVTNHMNHAPVQMGPIQGMETPFQVNQYKAYVP